MNSQSLSPLISEIKSERKQLSELVAELEETIPRVEQDPTKMGLRAVGSILHDYYTGLEKIFRLISVEIDGNLPSGEDWPKRILDRMTVEIENTRPPVIDETVKEKLGEYLRFRHLFRHIYGFELKWEQCRPLAKDLPGTHEQMSANLDEFQDFLREIDDASS